MVNRSDQRLKFLSAAVLSLSLLPVLLSACTESEPDAIIPTEDEVEFGEDSPGSLANLVGQRVTAFGEVEATVGDRAFVLDDPNLFDEDILVLNTTGEPFKVPTDADDVPVQATGEIRRFQSAELSQEYRINLQPDVYQNYENQPAMIAESIASAPTLNDIRENPDQFYGQTIIVRGEVENAVRQGVFTLDEEDVVGGEDLLVLAEGTAQPIVNPGDYVTVVGELRPFVAADFERDYDLNWDLTLQQELEAEYSQRPVLVARQIQTEAESPVL